jgi:hypothetical protein
MSHIVDTAACRSIVKAFLNNDRIDGVKHCHYFWHRDFETIMALDTPIQVKQSILLWQLQGFRHDKDILVDTEQVKLLGAKKAIIHIYKSDDTNVKLYGIDKLYADKVALAFGYMPGDRQDCLVEVWL